MTGILADNNAEGHVDILVRIWQSDEWREFWADVDLPVLTFADLGLADSVSNAVLWQTCQQREVISIACNRNHRENCSR